MMKKIMKIMKKILMKTKMKIMKIMMKIIKIMKKKKMKKRGTCETMAEMIIMIEV